VVVEPGDPSALAKALGDLLADAARTAELGRAARERVAAAFELDVVGDQLASTFGLDRDGRSSTRRGATVGRVRRRSATPSDGRVNDSGSDRVRASVFRRALTKAARRVGRFLGVSDLARSVGDVQAQLAASRTAVDSVNSELRHRVQMLEEEQLRLQQARAVWTTSAYLSTTSLPEDALISIVLPTHNRCDLVTRAIESVLGQSYANWELIVVVDGSQDGTAEALRSYDDPRITVLHQENRGQAAARNAALDKVSGDYVVYLDDDNVMYEHWLRGVAWAFVVHPDAEVVVGARIIDDEYRGRHLAAGGPPYLSYRDRIDRAALAEGNQADLMQLAHRRTVAERFDGADSPYEDWGFLARITRDREAVCFPALAGVYTTTASGRQMDADRAALDQQVRRIQRNLA
jgi:hypothetical protein